MVYIKKLRPNYSRDVASQIPIMFLRELGCESCIESDMRHKINLQNILRDIFSSEHKEYLYMTSLTGFQNSIFKDILKKYNFEVARKFKSSKTGHIIYIYQRWGPTLSEKLEECYLC